MALRRGRTMCAAATRLRLPMMNHEILIGSAGWSLPGALKRHFPGEESHLARYAKRFNAAEVNSSFYRAHRFTTWQRWAASVPDAFAFSLKLPRSITHEKRLQGAGPELDRFTAESAGLGEKRRCLLIQLPPSLPFEAAVADTFFEECRERLSCQTVLEARHPTWFDTPATLLLQHHGIDRVMADPVAPGDRPDLARPYFRLHGAPRTYYSGYSVDQLTLFAEALLPARQGAQSRWCIFDNTAAGHAIPDAMTLQALLTERGPPLPSLPR